MLRASHIILVIMLFWLMPSDAVRTYIVDDDGFANYETIKEAVAAAGSGDTIYIKTGIYSGGFILDKALKLMPLSGETGPIILKGNGVETGILVVADGCSIEGLTVTNFTASGIEIKSNGNIIRNNKFIDDRPAILVSTSDANLIESNVIENCFAGIALWSGSKDNNIINNKIKGGSISLLLNYVAHNTIANNLLSESEIGLHILNSSDVESLQNQIEGAPIGIRVFNSTNSLFDNNTVRGSTYCGIYFINNTGLQVSNSTILDSDRGMFTDSSYDCLIRRCTFENIINSMRIVGGSNNSISENTFRNSGDSAVELGYSNNNVLERNTITKSERGIIIVESSENTLKDNNLNDVDWGLYVEASTKEGYNNSINETNSVNGMPVAYLFDQSGKSVQKRKLAHLTLAYCDNFTVKRNDIVNDAMFLFNSSGNKILENNVSNCYGMRLLNSKNNNISSNKLIGNSYSGLFLVSSESNIISLNEASKNNQNGISLFDSNANTISNNDANNNYEAGIWLNLSNDNEIFGNNITGNTIGIQVAYSTGNQIYHNNFINNQEQAEDRMGNNTWDMGNSTGGNYWNDHKAKGNPSTIPKLIKGTKKDNYPFQDLNGWLMMDTK
ncbi:MAG: right-handed parallel beta-helix repeat-containing protein [Methanotrichaceae archaeon]|nr:right-handed parallel beta-helix repeat-containing protein [Methanotrichaceae archaeon]